MRYKSLDSILEGRKVQVKRQYGSSPKESKVITEKRRLILSFISEKNPNQSELNDFIRSSNESDEGVSFSPRWVKRNEGELFKCTRVAGTNENRYKLTSKGSKMLSEIQKELNESAKYKLPKNVSMIRVDIDTDEMEEDHESFLDKMYDYSETEILVYDKDLDYALKYLKKNKISVKEVVGDEVNTNESVINEAGESAGKMELIKTDVKDAREFAIKIFKENGEDLEKDIPDFDKNFEVAKKVATTGSTQRKDMPVIDDVDVKAFQRRLEKGFIDIKAPFSKDTDPENPFPAGISQAKAENWLKNGLRDGEKKDDTIKIRLENTKVKDLKPIQKQIYFDKSISSTAEFGIKGTLKFLKDATILIASTDNYIIDGHHRYLSGMLIDPNFEVRVLKIDLPISKLLPLTLSYGDSIGNKRNA